MKKVKELSFTLKRFSWLGHSPVIAVLLLTLMLLTVRCNKDTSNAASKKLELKTASTSGLKTTDAKQKDKPFANFTSVDGNLIFGNSSSISQGNWAGWAISKTELQTYGEVTFLLQTHSGDADLYLFSDNRTLGVGNQSGTNSELITLAANDLTAAENQLYFYVYGYDNSNYEVSIYSKPTSSYGSSNNGSGNSNATIFPATQITDKWNTSSYATAPSNPFAVSGYNGQCTWYAYARIQELADQGYIPRHFADDMYNKFSGISGRHAKNWPSIIGGDWTSTNQDVLPTNKRHKGLIVVWQGGLHGHVGIVEEVTADKRFYTVSEFNYDDNEGYRTKRYDWDGDDKMLGVYPTFFEISQ